MLSVADLAAWEAALDVIDPPARDVFAEIGYTPTAKQAEFHAATEFDVLFGGSLGGGKSRALMAEAIRDCALYPGIRIGAFRRSYGELKESLVPELAAMDFGSAVGGHWNGTEFELRFRNGSLLMLRYAENIVDATRRQGGQYQKLLFDERTLTPPDVVAYLESRLRSGRADIPVLGVRSTANPGGPGHGAVRARYIDATNFGEHIVTDPETGTTRRFIPSSMVDNPHLDDTYRRRLKSLPAAMRKAMLDGDWGVFAGQMFTELTHDRHVITPFTLPETWRRYNGVDWGFRAPWAVLWGAVDEDGRVYIYRELYATQVGESDQAKQILGAEHDGEHIVSRYADDALWADRGEAKQIAEIYADNGVYLTRAGKGAGSRVTGWQRIHSYMAEAPACAAHRALGWDTCPMLHLFPQVTNLYTELRDLPYSTKGNPEDADAGAVDHAADALRYLLANLGTGPEFLIHDEPAAPDVALAQPYGQFAITRNADGPDHWLDTDDPGFTPGAVITI